MKLCLFLKLRSRAQTVWSTLHWWSDPVCSVRFNDFVYPVFHFHYLVSLCSLSWMYWSKIHHPGITMLSGPVCAVNALGRVVCSYLWRGKCRSRGRQRWRWWSLVLMPWKWFRAEAAEQHTKLLQFSPTGPVGGLWWVKEKIGSTRDFCQGNETTVQKVCF